MSAPHAQGVPTSADVMAAQNVLDVLMGELLEGAGEGLRLQVQGVLPELRGVMGAAFSDVRTAGYLEGVQEGRREVAAVLVNALQGEGLHQ